MQFLTSWPMLLAVAAALMAFALLHVPMPHEQPEMRLRSHTSNILERPFLHYLNYNYHGEHHLYPRIPSRNLPALANWLKEQGYAVERSRSYLATLLDKIRRRQDITFSFCSGQHL